MSISTTKNVPKLRFPNFENNWGTVELKDILKIGSGRDYKHLNPGDIPVYGTGGYMLSVDDYLYDGTSICIGRKGTIDKPRLIKGKFWTVDTLFWTYDFKDTIPEFVYLLFQKINWLEYNEASGVPSLSKNTIEKIKVRIPELQEQEKIADFLTAVDDKIDALKAKLFELRKYKQACMQQIYSRNFRLKDEIGNPYPDWEENRIGDFMKERNTQSPKSSDYPLMAFIAYEGVAPKGERYNREFLVNDNNSKYYKKTEYGDFIYSSNNLETGSIGLNLYGPASISPVYSVFSISSTCDSRFLGSYLLRRQFIYEMTTYRQGVVYGQWRIHESDFLNIKVMMPSYEEQQKIADFLSCLDDKIHAYVNYLVGAKQLKQNLLQEMLV